MARKVINITHSANRHDILSQTPKNYDENNYFLKELQDKVNAEWEYRPNRVDIEYESVWGEQTFSPLEVVVQSVKSEKGEPISDDFRRIVFRDILDHRFSIGSRFRFGVFPIQENTDDSQKNVWLSINTDTVKMTASMIVERCNGTLGSLYKDSQGVSHFHYEPAIQGRELSSANLHYNETAISLQSQLVVIVQHNAYTKNYFVNQRFIIGYDKVYRIKAINKFYANSTFDSQNVGLIYLYFEVTESSPYDNFDDRIAYQTEQSVIVKESGSEENSSYKIVFSSPEIIPSYVSSAGLIFTPEVQDSNGESVSGASFAFSYVLQNLPESVDPLEYINVARTGNNFSISRKRMYLRGDLVLTFTATLSSGEEVSAAIQMNLRQPG